MTLGGTPIQLPLPNVIFSSIARRKIQDVGIPSRQQSWRHRIYRIPSQPSGEDFVYGADGYKRMKPSQGKHVDLYA